LARKIGEIDKKTLNRYVSPTTRERSLGTPTPERKAKEPDGGFETKIETPGTIYREPAVSQRTREPVDVYRQHITQEEEAAAVQFLKDCHVMFAQRITPPYDGMPRGDAGPRQGGVPDHYHDVNDRIEFVLKRITEGDKAVLVPLIIGVRNELTGQRTQIHDVARNRGVAYRTTEDLSKVGLGLLKAALDHVYKAYRDHASEKRQREADARALSHKPRQLSRNSK
jgi:hypothetical protein